MLSLVISGSIRTQKIKVVGILINRCKILSTYFQLLRLPYLLVAKILSSYYCMLLFTHQQQTFKMSPAEDVFHLFHVAFLVDT